MKDYYEGNKEKIQEKTKDYYEGNKGKISEYKNIYNEAKTKKKYKNTKKNIVNQTKKR